MLVVLATAVLLFSHVTPAYGQRGYADLRIDDAAALVTEGHLMRVCVIDPTVGAGVRMMNATFVPGARDTTVMLHGASAPLRSNVQIATDAAWFMDGEPLNLRLGIQKADFARIGIAREINAEDLSYLGVVRGVPVFVNRADLLEEVQTIYLPVQRIGCVFQPLQRQQQVPRRARV